MANYVYKVRGEESPQSNRIVEFVSTVFRRRSSIMDENNNILNKAIESSLDAVSAVLSNITASTHKPPSFDQSRVKYSCYRRQKLYCQDERGAVSFYYPWTLFVVWLDDTVDYWFRAQDVSEGIGFKKTNNIQDMKKYLSGDDVLVQWDTISRLLYTSPTTTTHSKFEGKGKMVCPVYDNTSCPVTNRDVTLKSRGFYDSHNNNGRTHFLTEEGLYQVYQFAPKCKLFRRAVAKLLRTIRQMVGNTVELTRDQLERLVEERVAEKKGAMITDNERAEYDRRCAILNDKLAAVRSELETIERRMQEQLIAKTAEYDGRCAALNDQLNAARSEFETIQRRVQELNDQLNAARSAFETNERRMQEHLAAKTSEISELYEQRTKLQDELQDLRIELEQRKLELSRTVEQLESVRLERDRVKHDAVQLSLAVDHRLSQLEQFRRGFRAMLKVYANPRNVSLVDGTFAIAKEPCVFFTHFGKVLVNGDEWRDAFCVMRRQRRGLALEMKNMFSTFQAEDGEFVSRINPSYRTIGVLSRLCSPTLATVDAFESPYGYRPHDFLDPRQDYHLNKHQRFLLLNTANAVSFMNMIVDGRYDETLDTGYSLPAKRSIDSSTTMVPSKLRRLYTRRRGDEELDLDVVEQDHVDEEDECGEDDENDKRAREVVHEKEEEKAKRTARLIGNIVERYPELSVALTLRRYRYKLPPAEIDSNDQPPLDVDRRWMTNEYHTASTIYYSVDRNATGPKMLQAIALLWKELTTAVEQESVDSLQKEIDALNELFDV